MNGNYWIKTDCNNGAEGSCWEIISIGKNSTGDCYNLILLNLADLEETE